MRKNPKTIAHSPSHREKIQKYSIVAKSFECFLFWSSGRCWVDVVEIRAVSLRRCTYIESSMKRIGISAIGTNLPALDAFTFKCLPAPWPPTTVFESKNRSWASRLHIFEHSTKPNSLHASAFRLHISGGLASGKLLDKCAKTGELDIQWDKSTTFIICRPRMSGVGCSDKDGGKCHEYLSFWRICPGSNASGWWRAAERVVGIIGELKTLTSNCSECKPNCAADTWLFTSSSDGTSRSSASSNKLNSSDLLIEDTNGFSMPNVRWNRLNSSKLQGVVGKKIADALVLKGSRGEKKKVAEPLLVRTSNAEGRTVRVESDTTKLRTWHAFVPFSKSSLESGRFVVWFIQFHVLAKLQTIGGSTSRIVHGVVIHKCVEQIFIRISRFSAGHESAAAMWWGKDGVAVVMWKENQHSSHHRQFAHPKLPCQFIQALERQHWNWKNHQYLSVIVCDFSSTRNFNTRTLMRRKFKFHWYDALGTSNGNQNFYNEWIIAAWYDDLIIWMSSAHQPIKQPWSEYQRETEDY